MLVQFLNSEKFLLEVSHERKSSVYQATGFLSKHQAQDVNAPDLAHKRILISITSPYIRGSKPAKLHDDSWTDVLRLEFHDIDPSKRGDRDKRVKKEKIKRVYFDEKMAVQVLQFLKKYEDTTVTEAIVHCEAGISRSAAISKHIAQLYQLMFPEKYNLYNKHVFSTMLEAYGQSLHHGTPLTVEQLPGITHS